MAITLRIFNQVIQVFFLSAKCFAVTNEKLKNRACSVIVTGIVNLIDNCRG
jgi:hypothetical protein